MTIDQEEAPKGIGTFRAHPSILKHYSYKVLIHNALRSAVIEGMADKNSDFYNDCIDNLKTKCRIQEEILSLEMIQTKHNWPVSDRLDELNTTLKYNYENEHPLADILNQELDTDVEFLLDSVINSWKTHTIAYT